MANSKPESKLIKAAGAVAWRPGPDGKPEILLVHRKKYDDWSLPKGKIEPGEPLPVTAVREVLEEGGARLALGRRLISVRYNVGGRPKRVHYWSAAVASLDERAVPNDEVDRIEWADADHAVERVSYRHDHGVLADFARLPAQTVPVILLRHAKAVAKSNWKRADDRRPLDDSGRADAKALAELLACFGPRARLITSPAARCVETLRPFAELSGAELREEPSLYIHHQSSRTDPADSPPSIAALLAEAITAGEPTIFCAHRENIPVLQAAALAALGLPRQRPRQRAGRHPRAPQGLGRPPPHLRLLGPEPNPPPTPDPATLTRGPIIVGDPTLTGRPIVARRPIRIRCLARPAAPRLASLVPRPRPHRCPRPLTPPRRPRPLTPHRRPRAGTAATPPHDAATPPSTAASSPELLAAPVLAPDSSAARPTPLTPRNQRPTRPLSPPPNLRRPLRPHRTLISH